MDGFEEIIDCDIDINENVDQTIIDSLIPTIDISSEDDSESESELAVDLDIKEIRIVLTELKKHVMQCIDGPLKEVNACLRFIKKNAIQTVLKNYYKNYCSCYFCMFNKYITIKKSFKYSMYANKHKS